MNTKEAIEFVKCQKVTLLDGSYNKGLHKKWDRIIELLQRGEKYEQMFNTILNWTIHDGSFIPVKELINLEQKYFPKSKEEVIK